MAKSKHRFFAVILYPESLPDDWLDKLESMGRPVAISPLHDLDKVENPVADGHEFKKAHYHLLWIEANPVTPDAVRNRLKRALGTKAVNHVEIVDSVEHYYNYLTHESKDAIRKNKHKYDPKDIVKLNDFDVDRYVTLDAEDKSNMLRQVLDIIEDQKFCNIIQVDKYMIAHAGERGSISIRNWMDIVTTKSSVIDAFCRGVYQERQLAREKREFGEQE